MNIDDIPRCQISKEMFDAHRILSDAVRGCRGLFDDRTMSALTEASLLRSVRSSIAIEGNGLDFSEVVGIANGEDVWAPFDEVVEARDALEAYRSMDGFDIWSVEDFLRAHDTMMFGLVETLGFRDHEVAVADGSRVVYRAPRHEKVPLMVERLFEWGRASELPPAVTGAIVHYYIESIHPFPDGNGRMGRLWNTALLRGSDPIYRLISLESEILERRQEYYDVLESCQHDNGQDCSDFVLFIMGCLSDAFVSLSHVNGDRVSRLLGCMEDGPMSSVDIMERLGLAHKTNFLRRYLDPAMEMGLVFRTESSPNSCSQMYRRSAGRSGSTHMEIAPDKP